MLLLNSKRLSLFIRLYPIYIILFIISCARPQTPTGGPKDEEPPQLVLADPENQTLNFKGEEINLEFNEFIQLQDVNNELIITPKINEDFEYRHVKRKVILSNLQLRDSTTYTFNFGNSVKDITENNPAENLLVIFSTGNYIDSLEINGSVKDILTNKSSEKALLALYELGDTLDLFTGRAAYSIKTNEEGIFKFTNLKQGDYLLYATIDKNSNYKNEPDREPFGYYPDTIHLNQNVDSLKIGLYSQNFLPFKITSLRTSGKYFEIRFNKYLRDYNLKYENDTSKYIYRNSIENNSILRIYNDPDIIDSIQVSLTAYDTIYQQIDTSFYVYFQESRRISPEFTMSLNKGKIAPNNRFKGEIVFNKPIKRILSDSIFFQYDSSIIQNIDTLQDFTWNTERTKLTIDKLLDPNLFPEDSTTNKEETNSRVPGKSLRNNSTGKKEILLHSGKLSFLSIENDTSSIQEKSYPFTTTNQYGIIAGEITTSHEHLVIQLVDKDFNVLQEQYSNTKFSFNNLEPADYSIRIIIDTNNNKTWDSGSPFTLTAPEEVYHLDKTITVRENSEYREMIIIPE